MVGGRVRKRKRIVVRMKKVIRRRAKKRVIVRWIWRSCWNWESIWAWYLRSSGVGVSAAFLMKAW